MAASCRHSASGDGRDSPAVDALRDAGEMLRQAPADGVTAEWLLAHLFTRLPECLFLAFTPLAIVPATSPFAGVLLLIIATPLALHRRDFILPRFLAARKIRPAHIQRTLGALSGALKRYEAFALSHPHPPARHHTRLAGLLVMVLSVALLVPLPFSNILPGLTIGTVAVASLEQDGRLFALASVLTAISLLLVVLEVFSAYFAAATLL